jgi:hypothetical protein
MLETTSSVLLERAQPDAERVALKAEIADASTLDMAAMPGHTVADGRGEVESEKCLTAATLTD